jgi:hypothetical protein
MAAKKTVAKTPLKESVPRNAKGQFQIGNDESTKKWKTPLELQKAIDQYFQDCDDRKKKIATKEGAVIEIDHPRPYTIEGLCEVLDCDRNTLLNYEKQQGYEPYFRTIKNAKNKIALNKVERGLSGDSNSAVTIFDLKNNHGYKDKTEVDNNNRNLEIPITDWVKGTDRGAKDMDNFNPDAEE